MSTSAGFDPNHEVYHLKDSGDLAALADDLRSIVGSIWGAYDNQENGTILRAAFGNEVSLAQAKDIFHRFRLTNRIVSTADREAASEVEAEDNRQRNTQGQFVSEHEIFYASKSASEIRSRMAIDREFGAYVRVMMSGEFQAPGDGVEQQLLKPKNTAEADLAEKAHPALRKFVKQYHATQSSQLRPVAGVVTMHDGTSFDWPKFQSLVSKASTAGLL